MYMRIFFHKFILCLPLLISTTSAFPLQDDYHALSKRSFWSMSDIPQHEKLPGSSQQRSSASQKDDVSPSSGKGSSSDGFNAAFEEYLNSRNYTLRDYALDNSIADAETVDGLSNSRPLPRIQSMTQMLVEDKKAIEEKRKQIAKENLAIKFMQQFGYVPQGDNTSDFLFTPSGLKEHIKQVQKFGSIPQTGEIDEKTIQLMQSPRCGVPDVSKTSVEGGPRGGLTTVRKRGHVVDRVEPTEDGEVRRRPKRYIIGGEGWKKRNITYHIENYSGKLHSMENVEVELRKAFDVWSSYARLNFTMTADRHADIIIYFAAYDHYDGYPFDGQGGTLAHAYYPYEFGHYGGDIHFDESEQWTIRPTDPKSGLDFFTVAVHEIGHSLGLSHSPVSSSIMFPYYKGAASPEGFALGYDDIMGMWELYIKRHLPGDEEYFNQQHSGPAANTTTTTSTTTPSTPTTTPDSRFSTTTSHPTHVNTPVYDEEDGTQNDEGNDKRDNEDRIKKEEEERRRQYGKDDEDENIDFNEVDCELVDVSNSTSCGNDTNYNASNTNNASNTSNADASNAGGTVSIDSSNATDASNTAEKTPSANGTIIYHGDSMTVDEYRKSLYGVEPTKIPLLFPTEEEVRREQEERRKWEIERRKAEEEERKRLEEEERKWYEEEQKRQEEQARKRELDRRNYEEEIKRKEEEARKQYEEELRKRQEENKREDARRRKQEEERIRREEEERMKAYEEEIRRYEEELRKRQEAERKRNRVSLNSSHEADGDNNVLSGGSASANAICNGNIDSAAKILDDLFMFRGELMFRFKSRGVLRAGYPAPIKALFSSLPHWTNRIDAVYQRNNDSVILFFIGKHFFEHRPDHTIQSPPRPLTDLGLPETVTQVDAAMFWPKNNKVYFFRHEEYWRYDEESGAMDPGYPKGMERWYGIPSFLDASITWQTVSYFFKGDQFWEFDNVNVEAVPGYPKKTRDYWFGHC